MESLDQLQQQLGIPGILKFETGPGGFTRVAISSKLADAQVYLHGAHVALFQPRGQKPVLFMSGKCYYENGKPIRGGVPLIFPWFGPHPTNAQSPAHGTVRLVDWSLASTAQRTDGVIELIFTLTPSPEYRLRFQVLIGQTLELALEVYNASSVPVRFEDAMHTYFAVSDIRQCTVTGLENAVYTSLVEKVVRHPQGNIPIHFTGETDRVYHDTRATCVLHDPGWQRRIIVDKSGSDATVVWNPWIAKAKAMVDFGDDEWPQMLCIETVNAKDNAVTLPAGQSHTMRTMIRVEPTGH